MNRLGKLSVWIGLVCSLLSPAVQAAQANVAKQLKVRAWVQPNTSIVMSQQLSLKLEISTPTWFSGGTDIAGIEIDDVVVLRRDKFASNSIRRKAGQTWTVQTWAITLYPQRAGRFEIPPIELKINVADGEGGTIKLTRKTRALSFEAFEPESIASADISTTQSANWVASNRLSVSERYSDGEGELKVGSAIKRKITLTASNMAAMMLPPIELEAIDGLAIYSDVAKLEDMTNRGVYSGSRTQEFTYLIERAGNYTLPELKFYWWDIKRKALRIETLPARQLNMSTGVLVHQQLTPMADRPMADSEAEPQQRSWWAGSAGLKTIGIVFAMLVGFSLLSWVSRNNNSPVFRSKRVTQDFQMACKRKDYKLANILFFEWWDAQPFAQESAPTEHSIRCILKRSNALACLQKFDQLMALGHARGEHFASTPSRLDVSCLMNEIVVALQPAQSSDAKRKNSLLQLN